MSAYNVTRDLDSESSNVNFLDVGIHDNLELDRVVFDKSSNGNQFIAFYFKNEDGLELSHTEWEPQDKDPAKLENKTVNQTKRIKHIATKFVSPDEFVFEAPDFKTFAENTIRILGNKYKGVKVRGKVVYNWNNYTSFPNYTPFLELMTVTKSKLRIGSADKMVKDVADRETTVVTNPFTEHQETSKEIGDPSVSTNDLPF